MRRSRTRRGFTTRRWLVAGAMLVSLLLFSVGYSAWGMPAVLQGSIALAAPEVTPGPGGGGIDVFPSGLGYSYGPYSTILAPKWQIYGWNLVAFNNNPYYHEVPIAQQTGSLSGPVYDGAKGGYVLSMNIDLYSNDPVKIYHLGNDTSMAFTLSNTSATSYMLGTSSSNAQFVASYYDPMGSSSDYNSYFQAGMGSRTFPLKPQRTVSYTIFNNSNWGGLTNQVLYPGETAYDSVSATLELWDPLSGASRSYSFIFEMRISVHAGGASLTAGTSASVSSPYYYSGPLYTGPENLTDAQGIDSAVQQPQIDAGVVLPQDDLAEKLPIETAATSVDETAPLVEQPLSEPAQEQSDMVLPALAVPDEETDAPIWPDDPTGNG